MLWIIAKYLMAAAVVVLVSELAKRSDHLGGLIAALPLVTILTLIWLHLELAQLDVVLKSYAEWIGSSRSLFLKLPGRPVLSRNVPQSVILF